MRSGDASATEYFELGAVMLLRKFYPAAIKYLQQAMQKWDRDEQDLAQVSYPQLLGYVSTNLALLGYVSTNLACPDIFSFFLRSNT